MTAGIETVKSTFSKVSDGYGRPVRSMRVSVTQRCDLACDYCHKEGQLPSSKEMTPPEIEKLVRIATTLGVRKVKITGGEPLMRGDIVDIITRLSPLLSEISLTTNGFRLNDLARDLKAAGLARVNVSLHTLNSGVYKRLCGVDLMPSVIQGIEGAVKAGLNPVKVNMVVLKGYNENEIDDMIDFCARAGAILQLIEYEASREGAEKEQFMKRYYSLHGVEEDLEKRATNIAHNELHRRRQYDVNANSGQVRVEVVRPMHNTEFCGNCTRIRLTSDGRIKPCLMEKNGELDVLGPLRGGASDSSLRDIFLEVVAARKPYWS